MAIVEKMWVICSTHSEEHSDTDDDFVIHIRSQGQHLEHNAVDQHVDERRRGATDTYEIDCRRFQFDDTRFRPGEISMLTLGSDAWRPTRFWVISKNDNGEFKLLIAQPDWPYDSLFSTDGNEGNVEYDLDQP